MPSQASKFCKGCETNCEKIYAKNSHWSMPNYDNETKDFDGTVPIIEKMDFFVDRFIEAYNNFRNMDLSEDDDYSFELFDPDEISE